LLRVAKASSWRFILRSAATAFRCAACFWAAVRPSLSVESSESDSSDPEPESSESDSDSDSSDSSFGGAAAGFVGPAVLVTGGETDTLGFGCVGTGESD
jgi:hypothetical protein